MKNDIAKKIIKISEDNSQMKLLQMLYATLCVLFVVIAGVISLFNQTFGISLLIVPLVTFTAFALNIVSLALVRLAISAARDNNAAANKAKNKTTIRKN